jgi:hypothetical protein
MKRQEKEQEAELRGDALISMDLQLGGLADTGTILPAEGLEVEECEKCNQEKNRPVDVNSFILNFLQKNSGKLSRSL